MSNVRVTLSFKRLPDGGLETFAGGVITCLTGNAAYTTPLVPLAELTAANTAFHDAQAAMVQGGTQATAYKNQMRAALEDLLTQEAYYVQTACKGDLATLLSSGYQVVNSNRTQSPLPQPVILQLSNPMSGQIGVKLDPVANAYSYELRYKQGVGEWVAAGIFASTRGVVIDGLTPGIVYTIQARAIGGSLGYSDWSDPQSRMAM